MKLIGYIEGIEIAFDFYPPKHFRAIIPKQLDGKYILQLNVIDDAGNESGGVFKQMYVDFSNLHFHILDENYKFSFENQDKKYIKIDNQYDFISIANQYNYREINCKYKYRELVSRCICN